MKATVTVSTKITQEEKDFLTKYCEQNDDTISRILRKALRNYITTLQEQDDQE